MPKLPEIPFKGTLKKWFGGGGLPQLPTGVSSDRQPFDLARMQHMNKMQKMKRQKLLFWWIPCAILVGLIALWFLLPFPLTHQAIANYNRQNYHGARSWLLPVTWTSPQPFIAAFDSGTIDTQLGKYALAQSELIRAYTLAPANRRCMVLQNLAYSLTAHAAYLTAQGSAQDATTYKNEAASLKVTYKDCFKPNRNGPGQGDQGGGGGGGAANDIQQVLTPAQQAQLQQKNQQGRQKQQQDFKQDTVNSDNPNVKPW